jgi:uncharacterized protein YcaQ
VRKTAVAQLSLPTRGASRSRPRASARGAPANQWRKAIGRLSVHQIDDVNFLVRAHYLPTFSLTGL